MSWLTLRRIVVSAFSLLLLAGCGDDDRRPGGRDSGPMPGIDGGLGVDGGSPSGCTPGAWSCAGNVYYLCGADGMSREMEMTCPGACNPTEGCTACMPGSRMCEGNVSMVCAPDGSGFVTGRDCGELGSTCGSNGFCGDACGAAESSRSNIGCEYWPVPLANSGDWEGRYDFRVVVANPGSSPANVRVFRGTTMTASATVPAGGVDDIVLPWIAGVNDGIDGEDDTSFGMANGAYRLLSDTPVVVAQFNPFEYDNGMTVPDPSDPFGAPVPDYSFSNDASLLLPAHSFTGDYIAASFYPLSIVDVVNDPLFGPMRTPGTIPGYIAVVGVTPEPTTVQIAVSAPVAADSGGRFGATSRGGSISFTINRGEVVHVVTQPPPDCSTGRPGYSEDSLCAPDDPFCDAARGFCQEAEYDLTGSRVQANHPIAVFGGHACAYVPHDAQACDHLENQMPPLQTWGTGYVSGPMGDLGGTIQNIVRVTAAFDGTSVTVDPPQGGVSTVTLGTGQWEEFTATSPFRVSSDQAIMVTQYLVGQFATEPESARGDPAMVVLPPEEQFRDDYTFVTPTSYNASTEGQSYLLVTRPTGLEINLDGSAVNPSWTTVGDREVGIVEVSGGTHSMTAAQPFGVIVYGMGQFTSYAYPAGLDLEEILLI